MDLGGAAHLLFAISKMHLISFFSWKYRAGSGRLLTLQSIFQVHSYTFAEACAIEIMADLQEIVTNGEEIPIFYFIIF